MLVYATNLKIVLTIKQGQVLFCFMDQLKRCLLHWFFVILEHYCKNLNFLKIIDRLATVVDLLIRFTNRAFLSRLRSRFYEPRDEAFIVTNYTALATVFSKKKK